MLVAALIAAAPTAVHAQTGWSATLFIDPYPSPYLSDWELNPNISTLTVFNGTGAEQTATAVYRVTNAAGRILASGRSDPQTVPPDDPRVYTSFVDIAGTSSHDAAAEDEMVRTGRIPEGVYRACVTIADGNGFIVGETCADFTIVYPDPPLLVAPGNGELVTTDAPFLQWTPMQLPPQYQLRYILQIADLLPTQTPDEALNGPVPQYVNPDVGATNLQYPLDAPPLQEGHTYAWRVVALDQNGYAAATNGGASETYVFRYEPASIPSPGQSAITLSMSNAFDHDAAADGGAVALSGGGAPTRGIDELCAHWSDPAGAFVLTADSPLGFRRFAGNPATLFQDDSTRSWWIRTTSANGRRDVLIAGGCDRFNDDTRVHWIASRNRTLQERIGRVLSSPVMQALPGPDIAGVNFSMIVLSKGSHTVSVPPAFTAGVEFLGDRSLDVATGLNVYSELDLEQFALWPFFQSLGYTEKRVTLYGFLGWDASWSVGGTIGSDAPQVDLSTEHQFLVLRATLPQRSPTGALKEWVQSMGLEFEIALGDSTGRAWSDTTGRRPNVVESLELIPRIIHRVVVNDDLTLEGSVGLDFARETKQGLPGEAFSRGWAYVRGDTATRPEPDYKTDVVITYGATGRLPLGPRGTVHVDALGVAVKFPFAAPRSRQEIMVSGEVGVKGQDGLGAVGIAFERTNLAALHTQLADARKARYEAGTRLSAAETSQSCTDGSAPSEAKKNWCTLEGTVTSLEKQLEEKGAFPDPSKQTSDWTWRMRASLGHLSIGDLIALIREGGS